MKSILLALLLALSLATAAGAQDAVAPVTSASLPITVHVGVYLLRIDTLDLKTEQATVTFYVWTRYPAGTDVDGAAFEVMNGTLESKDSEYLREEGGMKYAYYRCRATVMLEVDFHAFPFDRHRLAIVLEHAEADTARAVFAVDHDGMKFLGSPARSGWVVGAPEYAVSTNTYTTNWGMVGAPIDEKTVASRFRVSVSLQHAATATFVKTFLTLFISMFICFLAFLMHPEELEARVGVGVAGIFGAVTSHSVVTEALPEISYMTLADRVHAVSHFFIFTTLLATTYVGYLQRQDRLPEALRANRIAWAITGVAYATSMVGLTWWS